MEVQSGSALPYGVSRVGEWVNFALFAKGAEHVRLALYDEKEIDKAFFEIDLNCRTGEVWHIALKGTPEVFAYSFFVARSGQEVMALDPYAKHLFTPHVWGTSPYRPLAEFKESPFNWDNDQPLRRPLHETILYELHVRGFTIHPSSGVSSPGTFRGVIEKIPHLLDLGVNAVEFLPLHEFNEREAIQASFNYNGYSTVNFFVPMNRYSVEDGVIEFKEMVKALHKNGIEVILDVVFNHTFEGNEQGPRLSFKVLDAPSYYLINEQGHYLNLTGCGNTVNSNHPITREFISQALRYWVQEMHVDGFRFDLASIFYRDQRGGVIDYSPLVEFLAKDPLLADTKMIAEPWDPSGLYQLGKFAAQGPLWMEWNDQYRDTVRAFIKGTPKTRGPFSRALAGSHEIYGNFTPAKSVNFVTSHDGFSLYDLVSYNEKHNELNNEGNLDGLNHNESWNCGHEGATELKKVNNLRNKQVKNFIHALMVSQGTPMLLMGDEYKHTKKGNNNTWCQDNELNWFLWDELERNKDFYRFYKGLIHFRKNHPLLKRATYFGEKDIIWHGLEPSNADWDKDTHLVAFTLHHTDGTPALYSAFNAAHIFQNVTLPPCPDGKTWRWIVDTHFLPPADFHEEPREKRVEELTVKLAPYSSILLEAL